MAPVSTVTCALLSAFAAVARASNYKDAVVDLGYEIYEAASFDETEGYYNFSNIRYAAPPTGERRFNFPAPPEVNRHTVQDGSVGRICPQAFPAWGAITEQFVPLYLSDPAGFDTDTLQEIIDNDALPTGPPIPDPRQTEDCLFLDVIVPQEVFESRGPGKGRGRGRGKEKGKGKGKDKGKGNKGGAKVLVWIHGGGYVLNDKSTTPGGLLDISAEVGEDGPIIYVALNYRLGAFGWSSGPEFEAQGGVSNVALYDQRLALEWVQRYIHLFGGDPDDVTVIGESAGGGSIMHLITAFGGERDVLFNKAILQSPGFFPARAAIGGANAYDRFLELLNADSLADARAAPSEAVIAANAAQVGLDSIYGQFSYGPVVDGSLVPALPGQLLAQGRFDKSVEMMVGHNTNEGLTFTNPFVTNEDELTTYLRATFPTASADVLDTIINTLYPPVFDGSQGYVDQVGRLSKLVGELGFVCNTFFVNTAFNNDTYAYIFAVPPGLHAQDVPYTYYDGDGTPTEEVPAVAVAQELQRYIVTFAEMGEPESSEGVPEFPVYGDEARVIVLDPAGIVQGTDDAANERCRFWQEARYF